MSSIEGKWALVTGASRGIGRQVALGLAARGCNLLLHAREGGHLDALCDELAGSGATHHRVPGALESDAALAQIIAEARRRAPVDILYNNAAIMPAARPIWALPDADWDTAFRVNVRAPMLLCGAFAPAMRTRGYGRIVNVTSGIKDQPDLATYGATKATLDKYTRDLAVELAGTNVLVNLLDPGWLRTDLGGASAMFDVETVLPGALVPVLLDEQGASGQLFCAQDFRALTQDARHIPGWRGPR